MEYANLFVAYRAVCQEHADRTLFRIQRISFGETWKRVEARALGLLFAGEPLLFVDRRGNVVPSLSAAADVLRSGGSLLIFPEGTRSSDGTLGPLKSGAAYLAKHPERPVIPVTVEGSLAILPRGKALPDLFGGARGRLVVGEPIGPRAFASVEALNEAIRLALLKGRTGGKSSVTDCACRRRSSRGDS